MGSSKLSEVAEHTTATKTRWLFNIFSGSKPAAGAAKMPSTPSTTKRPRTPSPSPATSIRSEPDERTPSSEPVDAPVASISKLVNSIAAQRAVRKRKVPPTRMQTRSVGTSPSASQRPTRPRKRPRRRSPTPTLSPSPPPEPISRPLHIPKRRTSTLTLGNEFDALLSSILSSSTGRKVNLTDLDGVPVLKPGWAPPAPPRSKLVGSEGVAASAETGADVAENGWSEDEEQEGMIEEATESSDDEEEMADEEERLGDDEEERPPETPPTEVEMMKKQAAKTNRASQALSSDQAVLELSSDSSDDEIEVTLIAPSGARMTVVDASPTSRPTRMGATRSVVHLSASQRKRHLTRRLHIPKRRSSSLTLGSKFDALLSSILSKDCGRRVDITEFSGIPVLVPTWAPPAPPRSKPVVVDLVVESERVAMATVAEPQTVVDVSMRVEEEQDEAESEPVSPDQDEGQWQLPAKERSLAFQVQEATPETDGDEFSEEDRESDDEVGVTTFSSVASMTTRGGNEIDLPRSRPTRMRTRPIATSSVTERKRLGIRRLHIPKRRISNLTLGSKFDALLSSVLSDSAGRKIDVTDASGVPVLAPTWAPPAPPRLKTAVVAVAPVPIIEEREGVRSGPEARPAPRPAPRPTPPSEKTSIQVEKRTTKRKARASSYDSEDSDEQPDTSDEEFRPPPWILHKLPRVTRTSPSSSAIAAVESGPSSSSRSTRRRLPPRSHLPSPVASPSSRSDSSSLTSLSDSSEEDEEEEEEEGGDEDVEDEGEEVQKGRDEDLASYFGQSRFDWMDSEPTECESERSRKMRKVDDEEANVESDSKERLEVIKAAKEYFERGLHPR